MRAPFEAPPASAVAHKSTSGPGGSRWYNYGGEYQYNLLTAGGTLTSYYGSESPYMWFDTSAKSIYSGTPPLDQVHLLSVANVTDPTIPGWNDATVYGGFGEIAMRTTNSFTVDSVEVLGFYGINPTTRSSYLYDTLRVAVTFGSGSGTSGNLEANSFTGTAGVTGTLNFIVPRHDSATNKIVAAPSGTPVVVQDILLSAAETNDTDVSGVYRGGSLIYPKHCHKTIAISGLGTIPGGSRLAMSITFKSGDPNAPHMPPGSLHFGDTVFTGDAGNAFRYSMFRPFVGYNNSTGSPQFPAYDPTDMNEGCYKQEPAPSWGGVYLPMWAFYSGTPTTPSTLQYSTLGYHIVCSTCDTVSTLLSTNTVINENAVSAYPNPATNQVTIVFSLYKNASAVTVSLTDLLGQTVATQKYSNVSKGMAATINTSNLPSGMYIYSVQADGEKFTGRVVVSH